MSEFDGKVALVTGVASGMGKAIAKELARNGASIIGCDIDPEGANETVEEIIAMGSRATAIKADVSNSGNVKEVVGEGIKNYGKIDILVNCVGIPGRASPLQEIEEKEWDELMAIDLKSVFLFTKEALGGMLERKSGKIINISSVAAKDGNPNMVPYCSAKAGIIGFTKALAMEVASSGINVNCVVPGMTETPFLKRMKRGDIERSKRKIPLGRLAKPEEIAWVVRFLASRESDFMTGQCVNLTGGRAKY
jgi:Dehydrogenases with different specificities (related to short-chain alcohol dehydrogenases)